MAKPKLSEKQIQDALHYWLERKGYPTIVPNYSAPYWWEADLYALSKAGLAWEMEIKVTRSDFKQDAKKKKESYFHRYGQLPPARGSSKYEQLEQHSTFGPSRFSYVVPKGLITLEELPKWAGLIEIVEYGSRWMPYVKVPAPKLHNMPPSPIVHQKLRHLFYYRFWSLRHSYKGLPEDQELPDPLEMALAALRNRMDELEQEEDDWDKPARMSELDSAMTLLTQTLKDYFVCPDLKYGGAGSGTMGATSEQAELQLGTTTTAEDAAGTGP